MADCPSRCSLHEAQRSNLIVFNRVPKCGSTTLERIIKQQARGARRFHFHRSRDFVNNSISNDEQRELVRTVTELARQQRVPSHAHSCRCRKAAIATESLECGRGWTDRAIAQPAGFVWIHEAHGMDMCSAAWAGCLDL